MRDIADLAQRLIAESGESQRVVVAIAGPPGVGKSVFAEKLCAAIGSRMDGAATIVPMDGFHFDNAVLDARGLRHRKGAPETFDARGYVELMRRLARGDREDIAVPLFDRYLDIARAGASIVEPRHRFVLAEGNYLLLDAPPWSELAGLFRPTIWLDLSDDALEERLVKRWLHHGLERPAATRRAHDNDLPNARFVRENSRPADIIWSG